MYIYIYTATPPSERSKKKRQTCKNIFTNGRTTKRLSIADNFANASSFLYVHSFSKIFESIKTSCKKSPPRFVLLVSAVIDGNLLK